MVLYPGCYFFWSFCQVESSAYPVVNYAHGYQEKDVNARVEIKNKIKKKLTYQPLYSISRAGSVLQIAIL